MSHASKMPITSNINPDDIVADIHVIPSILPNNFYYRKFFFSLEIITNVIKIYFTMLLHVWIFYKNRNFHRVARDPKQKY